MLVSSISQYVFAEIPLLNFSRIRPAGRGRGANNPPPPPDYMTGMIQQFDLNHQFMAGVMAQSPQQNHQGHNQQPAEVALHDFTRLNPTMFRNSDQPLDVDDW